MIRYPGNSKACGENYMSQQQYVDQNESDKCVTMAETKLWIYQYIMVHFFLIVEVYLKHMLSTLLIWIEKDTCDLYLP